MAIVTSGGVEVPEQVAEAIREIRETGEVNMISANEIQNIANREGYYSLVVFIDEHRRGSRSVPIWIDVLEAVFAEEDDDE